jgi:hypothetical protein
MLADAAGVSGHPWNGTGVPPGVAVAQNEGMSGITTDAAERLTRVWKLSDAAMERMKTRASAATDGRFKLVRVGSEARLHDLSADPLEDRDVGSDHPDIAARLGSVLDGLDARPEPAAAATATLEDDGDDAEDLEERMKMLGYL